MKRLFQISIIILIIVWILYGCKTTKLDVRTGDKNPTWTARHMNKIHPYGFFAAGKYIEPAYPVKGTVKK